MHPDSPIFIAGHLGMVGAALLRRFELSGYSNIITRNRNKLDLTNQAAVRDFFSQEEIDYIILAAAKVGGIHANMTFPADFIYDNLIIQTNVIHEAFKAGISKLLFLGSSCIYPKNAPQPMKEESLLTGILEPTNEPYAIAKIAGIKMCEAYNRQYGVNFRSVMPTNLYGPGDNYHLQNSHVIPAIIRKYHLAKSAMEGDLTGIIEDQSKYGKIPEDICTAIGFDPQMKKLIPGHTPKVMLWGTGSPRREFLHVDDMAAGCIHIMGLDQAYFSGENPSFVNVGYGSDITIREVAQLIKSIVGYHGETVFQSDKPDGMMQKLLDCSRMNNLGWEPQISLEKGLVNAYTAYKNDDILEGAKASSSTGTIY